MGDPSGCWAGPDRPRPPEKSEIPMKTLRVVLTMLVVVPLVLAVPAQGQTSWDLGPVLGLDLELDELFLGGSARISPPGAPIVLNPGIEFYPFIGSGVSLFVVNFDVLYELKAEKVEPYIGGGLFWSRASVSIAGISASNSEIGLNLKGGVVFSPPGKLRPFAEGVIRVEGGSSLLLKGGLLFAIGG